jgi:invasion protein IalB
MKTERLIVGGVALLVGLLLGWMVRGVATYNPRAASMAAYEDWRVACPAQDPKDTTSSYCSLMSDVIDPQRGQPIAQIVITTDAKDKKPLIGFTLPHGVALEAGMGLKIGKDPVKVIPYRTCTTLGCSATAEFDDKFAASMKGATDAQVMFATLEGKPIGIPMSFKGYGKALSIWKGNDAKRKSWFWRLWS